MIKKFTHLHVHSHYSPQDCCQSPEQIAERTAALGMDAVALTDHGRAGGLLAFKKACEKHGVRPIYGFEAYVSPKSRLLHEKVEGFKPSYHAVVLAKNKTGLENLFTLCSLGWREGKYYKPRVDIEALEQYKEGLVILSGCGGGRIPWLLMEGRETEAKMHARKMVEIFKDDYYIEVQNHGLDWQLPLKKQLFEFSKELNIPIVATQDSHYQTREDAVLHGKICKIAAGDLQFDSDESYFKSGYELGKMFEPEERFAIDDTHDVAEKCRCEWEFGQTIWPVLDLPEERTPEQELAILTEEGFAERELPCTKDYKERIKYELSVINKMGFATYFLVVADFIRWAKDNEIPIGPGRGSAAGSLVCYCMGITNVDPIKYGLYFERFLNPSRVSLPDADIDVCQRDRKKVIEYITEKYGTDKIAQIGTYSRFKPRGSLRDFARVSGYEKQVGETLAKMVPPDNAGKQLSFDGVIEACPAILKTDWPDVVDLARKAEGLINRPGVHAAGIVIANDTIDKIVPLFRGKHEEIATQFDMHDVEEIGLVKLDLLGLKNLTVIADAVKLIRKQKDIEIDIDAIDFNDQNVYENTFQVGNVAGIFQFENSSGFKDLAMKVNPKSVADLAAITSLFRPGPLDTGAVDKYSECRNGADPEYLIPSLEPILNETAGVLTYQEQIMQICQELAGYTLAEADNMRKIIGKKIVEKMSGERVKFISGCVKNNIDKGKATELFEQIQGFALYSFNKSHAVAYSLVSYQTAWLKYYYPHEFFTALLNVSLKDQDDLIKYINACHEIEIPIERPSVNRSDVLFKLDHGTILFGFAGIKGIGEKDSATLVEARPEEGFEDTYGMIGKKINLGTLKALAECGALEEISDLSRKQLVENLPEFIKYARKLENYNERLIRIKDRENEIQEAIKKGERPPRKLPTPSEGPQPPVVDQTVKDVYTKAERLRLERQTLGFYLTGHPLDDYPNLTRLARYTIEDIKNGKVSKGSKVNIIGVVSSLTEKRTRKKQDMAVITIEDRTGRIEGTIFPRTWKKLKGRVEEQEVSVVTSIVELSEAFDPDAPPIVRVIVNNVNQELESAGGGVIKPLKCTLPGGGTIEFIPTEDQDYTKWQQAAVIASNIERM